MEICKLLGDSGDGFQVASLLEEFPFCHISEPVEREGSSSNALGKTPRVPAIFFSGTCTHMMQKY